MMLSSHGAWRFVATEFSKSDKKVEADDRVQERCALMMLIGAAYLRYEGVRSSVTLHWGPMREGTPGSDGSCVRTRVEGPMEPKKLACLGALSLNTRQYYVTTFYDVNVTPWVLSNEEKALYSKGGVVSVDWSLRMLLKDERMIVVVASLVNEGSSFRGGVCVVTY